MARPRSTVVWLLAAWLWAPLAWADDLAAQIRGGISLTGADSTDETGRTTTLRATTYQQRNQLSMDKSLFPLLSVSAGGAFDFGFGTVSRDGVVTGYDPRSWNGRAQVTWGIPVLNASLAYDYRQGMTDIRSALGQYTATTPVIESVSARAAWRPIDLPTVDLTAGRTRLFDTRRQVQDLVIDTAALTFTYRPEKRFELSHRLAYSHPNDVLRGVETSELSNAFAANWGDNFFDNRVTAYVSYSAGTRSTNVIRANVGGTIERRRFPLGGLSAVEVFPLRAPRIILSQNPALVDGNLNSSAGVNLGFGASGPADSLLRDFGGQFRPGEGPVNTIYVWIDKALTPEVTAALTWEAYRSDDNLNWTQVPIVGPVQFSIFSNRFEVTLEQTEAQFVKLVTRPVPLGTTTDERFRDILITELHFFQVVSAASDNPNPLQIYGNLNATARWQILRSPSLSYDVAFFFAHANEPQRLSYSLVNGVSFNHKLNRMLGLSARVERSDADDGQTHNGLNRWSASLAADPLPTLRATLSYGGQVSQRSGGSLAGGSGVGVNQSGGLFVRAELYPGISASSNLSVGGGVSELGQRSVNTSATAGVTVIPARWVTFNAGASYGNAQASGGGMPDLNDQRTVIDTSAALSPFRALALTGGISRQWSSRAPPATLASFSGAFSPFQQGDLQLRYAYQETLNTGGDQRTTSHGVGARWNIRSGWYFDAGYNHFNATTPTVRQTSYTAYANLVLALL